MSSKGVDCYGFRAVSEASITFSYPAKGGTRQTGISKVAAIEHGNVQIDTNDLNRGESTGHLSWVASAAGRQLATRSADINPSTGNLSQSDMGTMLDTTSVIAPDYAVSYGFYDAGSGHFGLTSQDQAYVYVTENYTRWMGDLAAADARLRSTPFNRFVLPGAHDAGMYDPHALRTIVNNATALEALTTALGVVLSTGLGVVSTMLHAMGTALTGATQAQAARALINLSFTQKDPVCTMLDLGIRYFDFRPGYCMSGVSVVCTGIYHQHAVVPGVAYDVFLRELLGWLREHPTEIVVLALGFAGFWFNDMKPPVDTLAQMMYQAQKDTGTTDFFVGRNINLSQTYGELLDRNCRLLLLNLDEDMPEYCAAKKYDSYHGHKADYQTNSSATVLDALNAMSPVEQQDPARAYDYTVFQLQGTVNATGGGGGGAFVGFSDATSPLLSTKPDFDRKTYPWVQQHLPGFSHTMLTVLLNDFADNALVYYAREQTLARLAG